MNNEISFKTFLWALIFGMGFHLGWGIIGILFWLGAKAVNQPGPAVMTIFFS